MEELLKKIKKIVDSGTPPTKQRLRGDPPAKESPVAKKRRLEKRSQFTEKTDRGRLKVEKKKDRGLKSYQDNIAKKGDPKGTFKTDEPTSIKQARDQKKDFFFDKKTGKKKAAVTVAQLAAFRKSSGNTKATLRDYLNAQKKKTKKVDKKPKVDTKPNFPITIENGKAKVKKDNKNKPPIVRPNIKPPNVTIIEEGGKLKLKAKDKSTIKPEPASLTKKDAPKPFVIPGKGERKLSARERRTQQLARLSFRSAQAMKPGEGRERAMEKARKIAFRDLAMGGTANSKNGKPIPEGSAGAGLRALKAVNPSITRNMGYAKMGGITKRRFGGMAKGGFKMPNKVSKS